MGSAAALGEHAVLRESIESHRLRRPPFLQRPAEYEPEGEAAPKVGKNPRAATISRSGMADHVVVVEDMGGEVADKGFGPNAKPTDVLRCRQEQR